jgi:hypothetical protein
MVVLFYFFFWFGAMKPKRQNHEIHPYKPPTSHMGINVIFLAHYLNPDFIELDTSLHYYKSGMQFTNLNHYGILKMK